MAPSSGHDYTDSRKPWDWQTKYPPEARTCINNEACILGGGLIVLLLLSGVSIALAGSVETISIRLGFLTSQPVLVRT